MENSISVNYFENIRPQGKIKKLAKNFSKILFEKKEMKKKRMKIFPILPNTSINEARLTVTYTQKEREDQNYYDKLPEARIGIIKENKMKTGFHIARNTKQGLMSSSYFFLPTSVDFLFNAECVLK